MLRTYETAPEYQAGAYAVRGHHGIAWRILGWEIVPDEDTEWSGYGTRTGNLLAVMVGDDRRWIMDPSDVAALPEDGYCRECGQTDCMHGRGGD